MTQEQLNIERMKLQPHTLEEPPKVITLEKLKPTAQCGYAKLFEATYNSIASTVDEPLCTIDIMGHKTVTCDLPVFLILKSLIVSNVCYSIDYSTACTNLFKDIIMSGNDHITKKSVLSITKDYRNINYETTELCKSIDALLTGSDDIIIAWKEIMSETNQYPTVSSIGLEMLDHKMTPEKLTSFLKSNYRKAKKDEDFFQKVPKGLSNVYVGALYWVYESNRGIL